MIVTNVPTWCGMRIARGAVSMWGGMGYIEILYFLIKFFVKFKFLLKIKSVKKIVSMPNADLFTEKLDLSYIIYTLTV